MMSLRRTILALALGAALIGSARADLLRTIILSGGGIPGWLPTIGSQLPTKYEDYTTGRYWYRGQQYGSYAAFATAVGASFSRASAATYTNAAGVYASAGSNVLRFDNPAGVAQGLLLEGAGTNLVTNAALNGAPWTNLNATVSAGQPSPDGLSGAFLNVPRTASARHNWAQTGVTATAAVYTASVLMKPAGYNFGYLGIWSPVGTMAYSIIVNLTTGAITQTNSLGSPTGTAASATLVGNGWVRLQVSMTASAGASATGMSFGPSNSGTPGSLNTNANEPQFAGDGSSGVAAFWPQLELGPFATSPVPTSGSAVTRAADALSNPWALPAAFTKVVKIVTPPGFAAINMVAWAFDDGTTSNRFLLLCNPATGHLNLIVTSGGVAQATLDLGAVSAGTVYTVAFAAQLNSFRASVNGGAIVSDTSGAMPVGVATEHYGVASNDWFGHFEKSIFYPTFAGDAALMSLAANQ